ncbi:MAG: prepilin peptidase [Myxococcales bacterium]|nr:prepilin peptidase [Myxococcales bacterium]
MAITELFSSCQGIASLPLCAGLLIAAALDMRSRRVPNLLTVALLVGGLVARGALGGFGELAWGLGAALGAMIVLLVPFAKGWLGGGDVKLFVALAAWLGPKAFVTALVAATLAGGVLAIAMLARRGRRALSLREASRSGGVPYAVAIAIGGLLVVLRAGGLPGLG